MSVRANLAALVPLCGAYLSCTARINDYFSCNVRNAIPPPLPPPHLSHCLPIKNAPLHSAFQTQWERETDIYLFL